MAVTKDGHLPILAECAVGLPAPCQFPRLAGTNEPGPLETSAGNIRCAGHGYPAPIAFNRLTRAVFNWPNITVHIRVLTARPFTIRVIKDHIGHI
jgi:hypothetical protein